MKLEKHLSRTTPLFILFLLMALVAFWPGYFSRLPGPLDSHLHRHGLTMTAWCLMLIAQAYLAGSARYRIHRSVGKFSYFLAPLVIITALDLVHSLFYGAQQFAAEHLYALALMVNAIVVFAVFYGLAVYFRKRPATHARFMICTIFPLFTPVTDRLVYQFAQPLIGYVPVIGRAPVVPVIGFALADLILLWLAIRDWQKGRRMVFFVALALLLMYHLSVLTFYRFGFWERFAGWFAGLPF